MIQPLVILLAALGDPGEVAIVISGDQAGQDALAALAARAAEAERMAGRSVLTSNELTLRLTGAPRLREVDEGALSAMLTEARDCEARFDTARARELRQLIAQAYAEARRPTPLLIEVAARALHDDAAAALADGDTERAGATAREALRRFPRVLVDSGRHGPPVQALFAAAANDLERAPRHQLAIELDREGAVMADGRELGSARDHLEVDLPEGEYRLWVVHAHGASVPRLVQVKDSALAKVAIEAGLTLRPDLDAVLVASGSRQALEGLCGRLHVESCVVVGALPGSLDGSTMLRRFDADDRAQPGVRLTTTLPAFSPWYLVPLGGGQLAQGRPVAAGAFLAAPVGLGVWYAWARSQHSAAVERVDRESEPGLRTQTNVALALFLSSIAAGTIEAVAYGLWQGE